MNDPTPLEELGQWALEASEPSGPKLTFSERCGIAWALHTRGVTSQDVRRAFALSPATVSWLKHCLQDGRIHYRDVWAEYQRLGPERFSEKYYAQIHMRLKRVRLELTHLDPNQTDIKPKLFAFDPGASKYEGLHTLPGGEQWEIGKHQKSWAIRRVGEETWHGAELMRGASEPFETFVRSQNAYDAIYSIESYDNPRPRSGRPTQ